MFWWYNAACACVVNEEKLACVTHILNLAIFVQRELALVSENVLLPSAAAAAVYESQIANNGTKIKQLHIWI